MDVFVAGGCSWDAIVSLETFPDQTGTYVARHFQETLGSTGSGKSLDLARLGVDTRFHAMIGADRYGEAIRERFDAEPVDFRYDVDPKGTERHVNLMNDAGERISIFVATATPEPDIDYTPLEAWVGSADAFVANPVDYVRPLLPVAETAGTPVWVDVHDYDGAGERSEAFVAAADYLFLSDESIDDYRRFMREQTDAGAELVVCTHGSDGVTALTAAGDWYEIAAQAFEVVDTNGAGDGFVAGYLYGHRRGEAVETCLRLGTLVGGLAVNASELSHPDLSAELLHAEYERRYGESLDPAQSDTKGL